MNVFFEIIMSFFHIDSKSTKHSWLFQESNAFNKKLHTSTVYEIYQMFMT